MPPFLSISNEKLTTPSLQSTVHVGVQTVLTGSDETCPKNWIHLMSLWPPSNPEKKKEFQTLLARELSGFVATADPPASLLVPELLDLYPDAVVLCTTRDKAKWTVSMEAIMQLIIPFWLGKILYFWLPTLRLMPVFWDSLPGIFVARHGERMTDRASIERIYDRHHAWLEETVPEGKLFYVDVKDGWGPICEALGVPVPEGVEFPRMNDSKDMEELFKGFAVQGIIRWGYFFGAMAVAVGAVWWYLR